jgi:multidrug efflux pump
MIGGSLWSMLAFALITVGMVLLLSRLPSGFLPDEDQAVLFGQITLPPGATAAQTAEVNKRVVDYLLSTEKENVNTALSVTGFNFAGQAQNAGFLAVSLKNWAQRPLASQSGAAIAGRAMAHFAGTRDAKIFIIQPPAVLELGNASGFDMELIDQGNLGHDKLLAARNQLLGMAAHDPRLAGVRPNGIEDAPQFQLVVDREKANAFGVATADINTLIEDAFGSSYVNLFMRQGRVKQVYVQGEATGRMTPDELGLWYLRNSAGGLVPFSAVMSGTWNFGPEKVEGYEGSTSFEIQGAPAPGASTGTAITAMAELAGKLPKGVAYQWTGLSFEQIKAGSQTTYLYAVSAIVILLCLAALYESWPIPFAVMLVVPLGVIGAIIATLERGLDNDVYFQVGLLTTVGLAIKNAILIVEFAKAFYDNGATLQDAAVHAAKERLRPILMTSLAFVCGVFPLAIASGAGAAARTAIGTAVVGGMVTATVLAVFFVPVFFVSILRLFKVKPRPTQTLAPKRAPVPAEA